MGLFDRKPKISIQDWRHTKGTSYSPLISSLFSSPNKFIHPIIELILRGKENRQRLIPQGNDKPVDFWLPKELR
jgi:hypothetical protein